MFGKHTELKTKVDFDNDSDIIFLFLKNKFTLLHLIKITMEAALWRSNMFF